ncbi:MAG: mitochondrial fission ELM1 family protein [Chromatiales bacterium]|nr:MAG: mitochondrial fission ELM1 family protein [Chromatiales bacterium]
MWAVLSYRSGENTQILALARELEVRGGWSLEIKRLDYRPAGLYNLLQPVGLLGIRRQSSSPLDAPWPDLVISAGLRNEPPCRWIREQSGGQTRVVFLGRSWISPAHLDLLVTTPQYRVPEHAHVLQNRLTLHPVNAAMLENSADRWRQTFVGYPGPRIGVLLGGSVGPYVLGHAAIDRVANYVNDSNCGSALISSSSRTAPGLVNGLAAQLKKPAFVYDWQPDDDGNPYAGILALADELIVSGDSIAMLSEAVATGKPVHILDLGAGRWSMGSDAGGASDVEDLTLTARWYRGLMRYGHRRWTRDITLVHRQLVDSGQATWLGEAARGDAQLPPSDMDAAVARIEALWPDQDSASLGVDAGSSTKRPSTTRYTRSDTAANAD